MAQYKSTMAFRIKLIKIFYFVLFGLRLGGFAKSIPQALLEGIGFCKSARCAKLRVAHLRM